MTDRLVDTAPRHERRSRVTLTNSDFNILFCALEAMDEDVKNYDGALDPYRLQIGAVEEKLQKARGRMR